MALVVDASIALAWGLPDESSAYADAVLAVVERDGLRVPDLWAGEIANGLAVAYRRRRITTADQHAFLTALAHLHIDVEQPSSPSMLNIEVNRSAEGVERYFDRELAVSDYLMRPERADLLVIDEASMLSIPQMLWLVKHTRENPSRVLLVGDSAQHRSVERGDALRILEQSGSVRYVELLRTQRQKVPARAKRE
jgi:predicted nucleic acid-binding protein